MSLRTLFWLVSAIFCKLSLPAQTPFDSLRLLAETTVYFDFGKADLRPDADSALQKLTLALPKQASLKVQLTAHTDSVGSEERNLELSKRRAATVRAALQALGIPDSAFQIQFFGEKRPTASNATGTGRQLNRRVTVTIFQQIGLVRINGRVFDPETGKGIPSEIVLQNHTFGDTLRTDTSGGFVANLPVGTTFTVNIFAPGYFFETQTLKAEPNLPPRLSIPLKPLTPGASIDLKNFYFVGNQDVLLPSSEPELPKLLKFMQLNPLLHIEIAGHINLPNQPPVPENSWNYELSLRRARRVYSYLVERGIEPFRMTYKGYGNWQMRYPEARREAEQAQNRRVEIKVLKIER